MKKAIRILLMLAINGTVVGTTAYKAGVAAGTEKATRKCAAYDHGEKLASAVQFEDRTVCHYVRTYATITRSKTL